MFYFKLAWGNLRKNKTVYLPFLASMTYLVIMNLLMQVMVNNPGMRSLPSAMTVHSMFGFGNIVIIIFSIIFSFYTNSFLIKRRQKELGLYNILGMDKKSLSFMLAIESLLSLLAVLVVGLISGSIIAKFLFLVLKKMTGFGADFVFHLSLSMITAVTIFFAALFLLLLFTNILQLMKTNPIELMRKGESGEKEPKSHWLLTLLGLISLGSGYYISLTLESPAAAIFVFFIAIILVIIGTYLLMITASVTVLKFLRKKETFYYRPKPFINISGMIYRMKQNGAGLASICILSTMVLVTVASTAGLYYGKEDIVKQRNPTDVRFTTQLVNEQVQPQLNQLAKEHQVKVDDSLKVDTPNTTLFQRKGSRFQVFSGDDQTQSGLVALKIWTAEDYRNFTGENINLVENQLLFYSITGDYSGKTLSFGADTYSIKQKNDNLKIQPKTDDIYDSYILFVKNSAVVEKIHAALDKTGQQEPLAYSTEVMMNISGSQKNQKEFTDAIFNYQDQLNQEFSQQELPNPSMLYARASEIGRDRQEANGFTGGFLFIGVIFGISFTVAAALIIYYKQVSEGYSDAKRFEIMQKVGLSHREVKQTIKSQILMVFVLPILLAVIHLTVAMPIIRKLLILFGLTNNQLITFVTIVVVAVFTLCYLFFYWQTSKVYYRIVKRN